MLRESANRIYDKIIDLSPDPSDKVAAWVGPYDRVWNDDCCSEIFRKSWIYVTECKAVCEETPTCTAINWDVIDGNCSVLACSVPVPPPTSNLESYVGYYISPILKTKTSLTTEASLGQESDHPIFVYIAIGVVSLFSVGFWILIWANQKYQNYVKNHRNATLPACVLPFVTSLLLKPFNIDDKESDKEELIQTLSKMVEY